MHFKKIIALCFIFILSLFININKINAQSLDSCNDLISYGDYNSCVKDLQILLNQKQNCNLIADGIFGEETYKCVKSFQSKSGLVADGIVGSKTKNALINYNNINNSVSDSNSYNENKIIVTASKLNVRKRYNENSSKVATVNRGTVLSILDTKYNNSTKWYKVSVNNKTGYISSKYTDSNFIIINISSQTLNYYKNNKLLLSTPIVSGNYKNYDTPKGYFKIKYKERNTYLRGRNADGSRYKSYVNYWMPFNKGIGLHNASWRGNGTDLNYFGGNIYKTNGSHGCINLPYNAAKTIYENVKVGTIVVVK